MSVLLLRLRVKAFYKACFLVWFFRPRVCCLAPLALCAWFVSAVSLQLNLFALCAFGYLEA